VPGNDRAAPPPPLRERLLIIDDFLPADLAEAMRLDIDNHFANPGHHAPATHQVWNYWFVPELYAYLRTQPEKVIDRGRMDDFQARLQAWSRETLGMGQVSWPYLSLYVNGCRQGMHNDSANGRFAFVYSLTRDERATNGGETIVFHESHPFLSHLNRPGAGRGFYDLVAPKFNRLVVFDDRLPHGVERVEGSMDPHEGRFVMHGHISEAGPVVVGALSAEAVLGPVVAAIEAFTRNAPTKLEDYHGPLILSLSVAPDGALVGARAMVDRVIHVAGPSPIWTAIVGGLLTRLSALRFPAADGPTQLILPLLFGATPPEAPDQGS
jgi:hypothetical protein